MTEAEMEKCDKNILERKIQNAKEILFKVYSHFYQRMFCPSQNKHN